MPLRNDPSLWFNLPGVVAAYQPVRAPDSLLARYNMAHGGDNRYRAEPVSTTPAWNPIAGWVYNRTGYFSSGIVHDGAVHGSTWSGQGRYSAVTGGQCPIASNFYYWSGFSLWGYQSSSNSHWQSNGPYAGGQTTTSTATGITGLAGTQSYWNGVPDFVLGTGTSNRNAVIMIGYGPAGVYTLSGNIQAVVIYNRPLSAAEMWSSYWQLKYCDVNPTWNVWAPRRKWFPYVLAAPAGRAGIYGARPTIALPGGVRIVPQDEGGVNG